MKIGITALCSVVPPLELVQGVEFLKAAGFEITVHPQVKSKNLFFAGEDFERAQALWDFARDPSIDAVWSARGGYGALRLLPLLAELTAQHGPPPPKLLIGSSDVTAILDFVHQKWGWATLHAPMPGLLKFLKMSGPEKKSLFALLREHQPPTPWGAKKLKFFTAPPSQPVTGDLMGGNLSLIVARLGTPFAPEARGRILFLEDVGETLSRIDRALSHLELSGMLLGVRAIVLGDFLDCEDRVPQVLVKKPKTMGPLRKKYSQKKVFEEIFGSLGERLGVPIASGVPAGHGPGMFSLPLYARYTLKPSGEFILEEWPRPQR